MTRSQYRTGVRNAVAGSAAPYGYTLTVWTSGAVLIHARGIPSTLDAFIFMVGAVVGFAFVGGIAFGGFAQQLAPSPSRSAVWSSFHVFSIGTSIGVAAVIGHVVENVAAWPLAGFSSTTIYLLVLGLQLAFGV